MSDVKVARRYAKALFGVAQQAKVIDSVEADLEGVGGLIERDPKFRDFLYSPNIGRDQKLRIMESLFSDRVTAMTMQALRLLLVKRREGIICEVRDEFVELRRKHGNVLYGLVTSAVDLNDATRKRIVEKLEKASGMRVEAEFRVDKSLIGGIKVAYGNYVLDGTIHGGLRRLRDTLRYELLKQS